MESEKELFVILTIFLSIFVSRTTTAEYARRSLEWIWRDNYNGTIDDGDTDIGAGDGGINMNVTHLGFVELTMPPTTRITLVRTTTTDNSLVEGLSNSNPSTTPKTKSRTASILAESGTAAVAGFCVLCAVLCVMLVIYRSGSQPQ